VYTDFRWKDAFDRQDLNAMVTLVGRLRSHTQQYLEHLGIDRDTFENEGLGLRPVSSADKANKSARNILARRYYRLAQWTEVMQGGYWLSVCH
jgi:FKBP12-rapamycin complex-associated protein